MSEENHYDFAVIGGGMFGSAAARHLSNQGHNVLLFAPEEPPERTSHEGVFASHYDEARITRMLDADEVWSDLATRSINRYEEIQKASGIEFHHPSQYLFLAQKDIDSLNENIDVAKAHNVHFDLLDNFSLTERMPFLHIAEDEKGLLEPPPAGYVNPRALVRAQLKCALATGIQLENQAVNELSETSTEVKIKTVAGNQYSASKVLLTTGVHTNHLLNSPLDLIIKGTMVIFAKLSDVLIEQLSTMPSISHRPANGINTYLLPPVKYPDGSTYVKIGVGNSQRILNSEKEIRDWFRYGADDREKNIAHESIINLIPSLHKQPMHFETCAHTETTTGHPYIGMLSNNIGVAVGGNGYGAKSSDEIGRLGAAILQGETVDDRLTPCLLTKA
ncbi:MAG: FAD-dependent oxidoreductase [Chloroflexi bacterium]|nr:FAD-dependent oxidoreductase [Chloroflexota bacterium]MCH2524519.1 FAD-binding oxidoreductase [Dehalococcoidia bacterium]|tara:strand:- start:12231 stop:13400 length:1170 start_codon:yes stop_codon:yes gene_type:complete